MRFVDSLRQDHKANRNNPKGQIILLSFRLAQSAQGWTGVLWPAGRIVGVSYRVIIEWLMGVELPWRLTVGPGLRIYHGHGLVINDGAVIGRNVTLRQGVTIGHLFEGGKCPVVEDDVEFGAHAIAIGDITIGRGSRIGPGVVLRTSVPAGSTVVAPDPLMRVRTVTNVRGA